MPKFSKFHYETIAAAIKAQRAPGGHAEAKLDALAEDLAALFEADNPRFNDARWFKACSHGSYHEPGTEGQDRESYSDDYVPGGAA